MLFSRLTESVREFWNFLKSKKLEVLNLTILFHHNIIAMPKRTIDDTELANGNGIETNGVQAKKKSRKEGEKSKKDKPVVVEEAEPEVVATEDDDAEAKAARKEKKRQKKLKKAEEEKQSGESEETIDPKAAKKAEKLRLKALKKAAKEESAQEETSEAAESASSVEAAPKPKKESVAKQVSAVAKTESTYTEDPKLSALPQSEIDAFLAEKFIAITDPKSTNLRPLTSFAYLPITDPAHRKPFEAFNAPTPIQSAAWPFLFDGRDVIGVAETGSGKTMAFAVPCVQGILALPENQRNKGARAVIVSPTRELAMQSYDQIMVLAKVSGLRAVCVYGGVPKDEQRKALRTADIVVATPGRLNDLINEGCADLSKARYVVLDEADRMLDKGFEEEIRKIINTTPAIGKRQTLMFTATWPESVRSLASTFMTNPVKITIGDNPTGELRANDRIVQKVEVVDPRNKEYRVLQLLKEYQSGAQKDDRILVFALYKKEATRIESFIRSKGFRVAGIHGDLSQEQRTRSLDGFKKGTTPILVATDVAARGLDIPAVKLVINCTFPLTIEDYVHRIGRTGRAGKEGLAITLFTEHDKAQSGV